MIPPALSMLPLESGLSLRLPRLPHRGRRAEDTAAGCRSLADASLARAAAASVANSRDRFEHSAASWSARADLLARLEAGHDARLLARSAIAP